jgi:hypothetical protein
MKLNNQQNVKQITLKRKRIVGCSSVIYWKIFICFAPRNHELDNKNFMTF